MAYEIDFWQVPPPRDRVQEALDITWQTQFTVCEASRFEWYPWTWFKFESDNWEDFEN